MKYLKGILILGIVSQCSAKDTVTVNFVKSFIQNEREPTKLIAQESCWGSSVKMSLIKAMFKVGSGFSNKWTSRSIYRDREQHVLFLLDLSCEGVNDVISKNLAEKLFRAPYRWLILSDSIEQINDVGLFDRPFLIDSEVVLAERNGDQFVLTELHRPGNTIPMQLTPRGFYQHDTLTDVRPNREFYERRRDIMGQEIIVSNVINDNNSTMYHLPREDRLELQHDSIAKNTWSVIRVGLEMLNATIHCTFTTSFGYQRVPGGSWGKGLMQDLIDGKAEMGSNVYVTYARLKIVKFVDTLAPCDLRFVLRQPPLSYVTDVFSMPFTTNVWLAILLITLITTLVLYLAIKSEAKQRDKSTSAQDPENLSDAFLLAIGAVSQQGVFLENRRISGRITVWFMFTTLLALFAAYSAQVVVFLQAPSNAINTLADLTKHKVTIAANDVNYNRMLTVMLNDPLRLSVYKKIEHNNGKSHYYDIKEGVELIRQGLFAFHSMTEPVYRLIEKTYYEAEKCDLSEINFINFPTPHLPVRKDTPYFELYKVVFKRIREVGIRYMFMKHYQVSRPRCSGQQSSFSSVGIVELKPVLKLMVCGMLLSVAILVAEITLYKLVQRHRQNQIEFTN